MEKDEKKISGETLRQILNKERIFAGRENTELTSVSPRFYGLVREYLTELENRLNETKSNGEKIVIQTEIKKVKNICEDIVHIRLKKIIGYVYLAIRGGTPNTKNMLTDEKVIYDEMVRILQQYKENIMKPSKDVKTKKIDKNVDVDYAVVRILEDISFVGTDGKTYNLKKNDIVTLPEKTAKILSNGRKGIIINYDFDRF